MKEKSVLILSGADMIFHKELRKKLEENNVKVETIVTSSNSHTGKVMTENIVQISYFLEKIPKLRGFVKYYIKLLFLIMKKKNEFKVINIHYASKHICNVIYILSKLKLFKNNKIILTMYGSDFYRIGEKEKEVLGKFFEVIDKINFTNPKMLEEVNLFYKKRFYNKFRVVSFGLNNLEEIRKSEKIIDKQLIRNEYGIKPGKIVVTCGYSAIKEQRHEEIIEQILKLDNNLKEKIYTIFPMNYGTDKVKRIKKIENILKGTNLDYYISKNYLTGIDLAKLRRVSDIMINIQTTDQFSGSMQEYIFSGNIVITGKWLPYDIFIEKGIKIIRIENINELSNELENLIKKEIVFSEEEKERSKKVIWELSSWESNFKKWEELFFGVENEK